MSKIEIEDLREAGEDCGDLMGWFCHGHVDKHDFRDTIMRETDHDQYSDYKCPKVEGIEHIYWRKVPIRGESGMVFHTAKKGTKGAFPATVWDFANFNSQSSFKKEEDIRKEGRAQGQIEAMSFAFTWLKAVKGIGTAEELLASWNKDKEPKKEAA